jgi:acyl-CoA thioesterase
LAARASIGDEVLAETRDARRLDVTGGAPTLWFPAGDAAAVPAGLATAGEGGLAGYVAFDPEAVRVDLIDGRDGDDPRDVTVKRFPTWGDADDLVALLDVRPDGDGRWVGGVRGDWRRPVVDGSQMLGQAVVAAGRHTGGRRPVSATMAFLRAADARRPVAIELDPVADGRTFTAFAARAVQDGKVRAAGTLLLDATAEPVIRHAVEAPDVPGPYDSVPCDMSVTGRDIRIVDGAYTGDPDAPVGPPVLDAWVRFRQLPDDPCLHAGMLAQFTGHLSIAAALRPHAGVGQDQAHRSLSTAVNAISLSLHRAVRVDRWVLYHHRSTFAGDGMTHAECRVHDEGGDLLASFTVDAMVRGFADPGAPVDARTSL